MIRFHAPQPLLSQAEGIVWNCQGLTSSKMLEIRNRLKIRRPIFVVLIETHRPDKSPLSINVNGYNEYPFHARYHNLRPAGGMLVYVRADCAACAPLDTFPGFNIGNRINNANISSQWAGLTINVHGWKRALWLIPIYLQSRENKHIAEHSPLTKQLEALVASAESRPDAQRPWIILTGDLNSHSPLLGIRNTPDKTAFDIVDDILSLGFNCANRTFAYATSTRSRHAPGDGAVLDLAFELPLQHNPIIADITIDHPSRAPSLGLIHSDHLALTLTLAASAPAVHNRYAPLKWNTDRATADDWYDYQNTLASNVLSNVDTFRALHEFAIGVNGVTEKNYRSRAQPLAEAALEAINQSINHAASTQIGERPRDPFSDPDWSPLVKAAHRELCNAERALRRDPDPDTIQRYNDCKKEYSAVLRRHRIDRWNAVRASAEQEGPNGKNTLSWSAVRRFSRMSQPKASAISAGLRRPNGTLTTSIEESRTLLGDHYESVFRPFDPINSAIPNAGDADERAAAAAETARRDADLITLRKLLDDESAPPAYQTIDHYQSIPDGHPHKRWMLAKRDDIIKLLEHTNTTTAAGPDRVDGQLIRHSTDVEDFVGAVFAVANFCFAYGILPQICRRANLMPIPKKAGVVDECGSYRPISVTPILMRRIERLAQRRLQPIAEDQLSPWQAGFRKGRSTRQQVLHLIHTIQNAVTHNVVDPDTNTITTAPYPVVFLDIQKAFDSVPHEYILLKLWRAMVRRGSVDIPLLNFVRAFLHDRQFRIATHTIEPGEWRPISAGVPQGAVNSPDLYSLFIDDLLPRNHPAAAFITETGALAYADDATAAPAYTATLDQRCDDLQRFLNHVGSWARCWSVRFSNSKSAVVWFVGTGVGSAARTKVAKNLSTDAQRFHIPYANHPSHIAQLPFATRYQYLGVWLDSTLNGVSQYEHMVAKVTTVSSMLRRIQQPNGPPGPKTIRTLTRTLLVPRITYGLPFLDLKADQYRVLNRLMLKPIQSSLTTASSAHRAGTATYTHLPTLEIQRDLSLITMVASVFRTSNNYERRLDGADGRLPGLWLLAHHCTRERATAAIADIIRPRRNDSAMIPITTMIALAAKRLGVLQLLPTDEMLTRPDYRQRRSAATPTREPWQSAAFLKAAKRGARLMQTERMALESRGLSIHTGGIRHGEPHAARNALAHNGAAIVERKGTFLPPTLGIADNIITLEALRATMATLPHILNPHHRELDSIEFDLRTHAQRRARLVLNREMKFAAVAHYHNKDPSPALRQCPHCARYNVGPLSPPAETALHAISQCPAYARQRASLRKQLADCLLRIRQHTFDSHHLIHLRTLSDEELLLHAVMATPYVLEALISQKAGAAERRTLLLRTTGRYLIYIHNYRPP